MSSRQLIASTADNDNYAGKSGKKAPIKDKGIEGIVTSRVGLNATTEHRRKPLNIGLQGSLRYMLSAGIVAVTKVRR
jgi:hypothetical protein